MKLLSAAAETPKSSDRGSIVGLRCRGPVARDAALFLALAALAAVIYLPTLWHGFVEYDDPSYVSQNPKVLGGLTWDGMRWALTATHASNWHPLTWLSLQLDATLLGTKPSGYHFTNLLMHAANAGLVYLLLRRLTGAVGRSWVAAALFAAHPLHVESVAWIAERKDVLSGLFGLLALLAYERYGRAPSAGRMALVTGLFLLGLMAKPMLVTLPFVMLLLDAWPLRRLRGPHDLARLCGEKTVLFVLVAASCAVTLSVQHKAMSSFVERTIPGRLGVAGVGYLKYLEKTFYPANLAVLYPLPDGPPPVGQAILGWLVIATLTGIACWLWRSAPYLLVGWLWFLGMLVPVIGAVQVGSQLYADRYTYLPHVGLCLALVWAAADLAGRIQAPGWIRFGMAVAVVAGCALRAADQVVYWRSNTTLWEHAVAATEDNYIAYCNLGVQYVTEGRLGDALRCYTETSRASPYMFDSRASQAHTQFDLGRLDEAGTSAAAAVKLAAQHPAQFPEPIRVSDCWYILGKASLGRGRDTEALDCYREALRHHPLPVVHFALGTLLARLGCAEEAVAELEAARAATPSDPAVNFNLGVALSERGKWTRAAPVLADAVRGDPANTTSRNALAAALLATGQTAAARAQAGELARADPEGPARAARAAWGMATHPDQARRRGELAYWWARAACLAANPPPAEVLDALAAAAAECGRFEEAVVAAERAGQLAAEAGRTELAGAIRNRLALYRSGRAFHGRR